MSNRTKGAAFEKRVQEYLISLGYAADRARPALKFVGPGKFFSGPNDFLGCADIMAVHKEKPYTLFIQCHAGDNFADRKRKMAAVPWNLKYQRVHIWGKSKTKRSHIRLFALDDGGWIEAEEHILFKNSIPLTGPWL